jgi:hypothetical protein
MSSKSVLRPPDCGDRHHTGKAALSSLASVIFAGRCAASIKPTTP